MTFALGVSACVARVVCVAGTGSGTGTGTGSPLSCLLACSLISHPLEREVCILPFFLLLHLFFAAIHIRLSPPLPCPPPRLSRSRSECLNKIKSVPACASTGSYRMNGSRRHCSAQHWLPRTRSPTLTTTCASASASERERE